MSKAWKAFEKQTAEFFGGLRRIRIMYNESVGDVIHPYYSIECKYGGQVPNYLAPYVPTELEVGGKYFQVVPSNYITIIRKKLHVRSLGYVKKSRKSSKFLDDTMDQARRYNPTLGPIVCVKPKYWRGFIIIWEV